MGWSIVELCCGTASLTYHLIGADRPLVPYQGTKWRYRKELVRVVREMGFEGPPDRALFCDKNEMWPFAHALLLNRQSRQRVIQRLVELNEQDPRAAWDYITSATVHLKDSDGLSRARARTIGNFLFLQRMAYGGKAVATVGDSHPTRRWVTPGFNSTSAYGREATERFGAVLPQLPSLIRRLQRPWWGNVTLGVSTFAGMSATSVVEKLAYKYETHERPRTLIYIDPPYQGTTSYPGARLGRPDLVSMAQRLEEMGFRVLISELEPVEPLTHQGWLSQQIAGPSNGDAPIRSKSPEFVTYSRGKHHVR